MTRYLLHGGKPSKASVSNQVFYQEMFKGLSGGITLLCVYFARDARSCSWLDMFEEDKRHISAVCPDVDLRFVLASDHVDVFPGQVRAADVVFLKGGDASLLRASLRRWPSLETLWEGKVVAGASAGALVLSEHYFDGDRADYQQGLGILPLKLICHWGASRADRLEGLEGVGRDLPVVTIPEEHHVLFVQ